jgi:hypothetical protein
VYWNIKEGNKMRCKQPTFEKPLRPGGDKHRGTNPQPNENKPEYPKRNTKYNKPPLGLEPKWLWKEIVYGERYKALLDAVRRYSEANYTIPNDWLEELIELNRIKEV